MMEQINVRLPKAKKLGQPIEVLRDIFSNAKRPKPQPGQKREIAPALMSADRKTELAPPLMVRDLTCSVCANPRGTLVRVSEKGAPTVYRHRSCKPKVVPS